MNNYLLLEIGVEELPSRFGQTTLDQIENNLSKLLKEERVNFDNIDKYATPRRLTFVIKNSVDEEGNFTKPALGFMKSKGLDPENVYFKQVGNAEYLFGTIKQSGKETAEILKNIIPTAIKNVTFPKAMRWGGKNMRFARPIRWMVALLNDNVLDVNLEGIKASNVTKGHRFLGEREFEVNSVEDYFEKLEKNYIILDQHKRKAMIKEQTIEVAN